MDLWGCLLVLWCCLLGLWVLWGCLMDLCGCLIDPWGLPMVLRACLMVFWGCLMDILKFDVSLYQPIDLQGCRESWASASVGNLRGREEEISRLPLNISCNMLVIQIPNDIIHPCFSLQLTVRLAAIIALIQVCSMAKLIPIFRPGPYSPRFEIYWYWAIRCLV